MVDQALILLCNSLENHDQEFWAVSVRRELMSLATKALTLHPTNYNIQYRGLHLFAQLLTRGEAGLIASDRRPLQDAGAWATLAVAAATAHPQMSEVVAAALCALWHLALGDESTALVIRSGGVRLLL